MPDIIYYQLGAEGLEQLAIATETIRKHEPNLNIILYSDQDEQAISKSGSQIDELRFWADPTSEHDQATYGSGAFGIIMHEKIRVVLDALSRTDSWILYSDVDIVSCHPFCSEIDESLNWKPLLISSEGDRMNPLNFCMGLFAVKKCQETTNLIQAWKTFHAQQLLKDTTYHDQLAFNDFFQLEKLNISEVGTLPQGYAMPGWMFPLLAPIRITRVQPRFFHCNWVKGHQKKVRRMKTVNRVFSSKPTWRSFIRGIAAYTIMVIRDFRPPFRSI